MTLLHGGQLGRANGHGGGRRGMGGVENKHSTDVEYPPSPPPPPRICMSIRSPCRHPVSQAPISVGVFVVNDPPVWWTSTRRCCGWTARRPRQGVSLEQALHRRRTSCSSCPALRVCMSIHPDGESCSDLGCSACSQRPFHPGFERQVEARTTCTCLLYLSRFCH